MMTKRERFLKTINRETVDRPAKWIGIPTNEAIPKLFEYFEVNDFKSFKNKVNDDVWVIEMPYNNGTTNAIYQAFDFNKKHTGEYTLTGDGFFNDFEDPSAVELFDWPNPENYIDPRECMKIIDEAPKDYALLGVVWSAHFQDACAAFGMENSLVIMKTNPELFRAVIDRITDFYIQANEIFYKSTEGKLDAVLIGNDFGTQCSLIVSPDDLREFVFEGTKRLVQQAKSYGLKVIHHSCGAIFDIIPDLIECGVDVIHPIQALATGMGPEHLKESFGDRVSFCGGVDAQNLLVNGTASEVRAKIKELSAIFPTGLVF